jgi:copper transport protein
MRSTVVQQRLRGQLKRPSIALACVLWALAAAPSALAHARLLATQPAQGTVLPQAPAQVSFSFDEGVHSGGNATLQGGSLGKTEPLPSRILRGGRLLVATLPARLADGDYVVTWRVVSDDGHLETGALAFGVGVGTPPPAAVVGQRTQRDLLLAVGRWIFLAGLLGGAGIAGVRLAVGRREPDLADGGIAGALAVATAGALLELSRIPHAVETRFGLVTAIAAAVAAAGALTAVARLRRVAETLALSLVAAPALAGHALASDRPTWLAFPADVVHTAAAAVWVGGVLWLAILAGRHSPELGETGRRFARVALVAIAVLGASGVARAGAELRSLDEVTSTGYGRLLVAKSVLFATLLAAGWLSARSLARLGRLRLALSGEIALLAGLIATVAALGSVTPPRNAPARLRPLPLPLPGPAVVFGREAGTYAVGIAAAARSGQLGVRATVLDQTGSGRDGLDVTASADGGPWTTAARCGRGLYCATLPASSPSPRLRLRVAGHVLTALLPSRPRHAQARRLVEAAAAATRALRTVVIREQLAANPSLELTTTFRIKSPDQMTYSSAIRRGDAISQAGRAIVIGARRWDKPRPTAPWVPSEQQPLNQPAPDWRVAVDPSLLGSTKQTWLVSFRDPTVPAWIEVTIDRRTGRPLRVDMTAAAHFMVREWGSFDEPLAIEPPSSR